MSDIPGRFWHARPIVTVEFARIGWDVALLFEDQREHLDSFGTIGRAVAYAQETASLNEIRFVPGAARPWLLRQGEEAPCA